jgi:hypothetical protein
MGKTQILGSLVNTILTDSSNNVGIGGAANASFKLQVTGATNLTGALSASTATFESSGSGNTFLINHTSGSGIALTITKGGNGEGLIINKTSGTGNALSVTGTTSLGGALSGTSATFSGALTFANGGGNYLYGGALRVLYSNGTNTNNIYSGGVNGLRVINQADTAALLSIADTGAATFSSSLTANGVLVAGAANGNIQIKGSTDGFLGVGVSDNTLYLMDWVTAAKGLKINLTNGVATFTSSLRVGGATGNFIIDSYTTSKVGVRSWTDISGTTNNFFVQNSANFNYGVVGVVSATGTSTGDVYALGYTPSAGTSMTPVINWASVGNVGIGTSLSLSSKLVVNGGLAIGNNWGVSGATLNIDADATGSNGATLSVSYWSGSYGPMKFNTSNTERLRIGSESLSFTASIMSASDANSKTFMNAISSDCGLVPVPAGTTLYCYNRSSGTNYRALITTSTYFTGQHGNNPIDLELKNNIENYVGMIVSSVGTYYSVNPITQEVTTGKDAIQISEALPQIKLTDTDKDKTVWGVVTNVNNDNFNPDGTIEYDNAATFGDRLGPNVIRVNSLGEGAIWVTNINGNIENGDYICSSLINGYGRKQDDDMLHNYSVAKSTMDCDFDLNNNNLYKCEEFEYDGKTYKRAFIGCTYHCA